MKGQDVSVPWQMIRKKKKPVSLISEGKQSRPAISVTEPRPPRAHAHPGPSRRVHGQPQDQPGSRLIQQRSNRWQKAAANPGIHGDQQTPRFNNATGFRLHLRRCHVKRSERNRILLIEPGGAKKRRLFQDRSGKGFICEVVLGVRHRLYKSCLVENKFVR